MPSFSEKQSETAELRKNSCKKSADKAATVEAL